MARTPCIRLDEQLPLANDELATGSGLTIVLGSVSSAYSSLQSIRPSSTRAAIPIDKERAVLVGGIELPQCIYKIIRKYICITVVIAVVRYITAKYSS